MNFLLYPDRIAVVGASAEAKRIGGRPIDYLKKGGFKGEIYPVNPSRESIQGFTCYPSLSALPKRPDMVIIALAREHVLATLKECVEMGVGSVVIFSAGFAEIDEEGKELQHQMSLVVKGSNTRVLGPNANGLMVPSVGLYACFTPLLERGIPSQGGVAILTQSAALGTYLLDKCRTRSIGIACWMHTGNELDVDLLDALDSAIEMPSVTTILLTSEVLREPMRLQQLLMRAAAKNKLIAVLQVGHSNLGAMAAASHTGALVGSQSQVSRGLLQQGGAHHVSSLRQLVDIAEGHVRWGRPGRARVSILTTSGGIGIMVADALESSGVVMPRLSDALQLQLMNIAPFCHPANPVDVTAQIINETDKFEAILLTMASSDEVDIIITFLPLATSHDPLTQQLCRVATKLNLEKSNIHFGVVGTIDESAHDMLNQAQIGRWEEPDDLRIALGAITAKAPEPWAEFVVSKKPSIEMANWIEKSQVDDLIGESESKQWLRDLGLPVIQDRIAGDAKQAGLFASEIGFPVALKLQVPGVAHKAAMGGVQLNLQSQREVQDAAQRMLDLPGATTDSLLLIEPMLSGMEFFVGVTQSMEFGFLGLLGLGGVQVEDKARMSFRYLHLSKPDINDMLNALRLNEWLDDMCIQDTVVDQLNQIFKTLSQILIDSGCRITTIELNPVMINYQGQCTIVDALFETTSRDIQP